MGFEGFLTIAVVVAVFGLLATDRFSAEFVVLGGLVVLLISQVLTPLQAFAGFSNPGVVALAGLYVLTGAIRATGGLDVLAHRLLSHVDQVDTARRRLTSITCALSAFLNNTPIVAMVMPTAVTWARRRGYSPRGLLIPLSYAAVLGGTCTLIGTSTHLVVHGLLLERGMPGLKLFELTPIGLPVALVGLPMCWFLARRLLRGEPTSEGDAQEKRREYTADLVVLPDSPDIGHTVEAAGLRNLPGLFLVRIERDGRAVAPVTPGTMLVAGDRLTFAGILDTIVDLQHRRGLAPADHDDMALDWNLHEAVISRGSPLVGRTIRGANFRGTYNAAVVAVHRHGELLETKLGDIALRPGDTLLLQAAPGFARTFRDSTDFYLVSQVTGQGRPRRHLAPVAVGLMAAAMALAAFEVLPLSSATVAGALLAVMTGCISPGGARRSVDTSVLMVVASALGIAFAVTKTGVAAAAAGLVMSAGEGFGPIGLLAVVYFSGMLLTELVTNTAAAALVFPIALAVAASSGLDPRPFVLATTISASLSLATPLGYQTNMMVYGPGGYRFMDFVRMGVPLQLVTATVALTALWVVYF